MTRVRPMVPFAYPVQGGVWRLHNLCAARWAIPVANVPAIRRQKRIERMANVYHTDDAFVRGANHKEGIGNDPVRVGCGRTAVSIHNLKPCGIGKLFQQRAAVQFTPHRQADARFYIPWPATPWRAWFAQAPAFPLRSFALALNVGADNRHLHRLLPCNKGRKGNARNHFGVETAFSLPLNRQ